ncbi:hypothetical protein [Catellatospora citrea]|nr:hypothetical protein [Catellatospora citrea]RKE10833.1 hypothetical protein C8E86_5752 [Catellatospora citrea]
MAKWSRPYGDAGEHDGQVTVAVLASAVVAVLIPAGGLAAGEFTPAVAILYAVFIPSWVTLVWRVTLVGVYVGFEGIKIRHVWRTRMIPWTQLNRAWAGQADDFDAWQIWVTGGDPERDHPTPIWRAGSRTRHRNRIVLDQQEFVAVLAALNRRP